MKKDERFASGERMSGVVSRDLFDRDEAAERCEGNARQRRTDETSTTALVRQRRVAAVTAASCEWRVNVSTVCEAESLSSR